MYREGLGGVRINSSHGSHDLHLQVIENTRQHMPDGYVVYDIKGPKIRLGDLYRERGIYYKAREKYEDALLINPDSRRAKRRLNQ